MAKVQGYPNSLYANKIILGPMVRVCTLPMRLLALRYGADLVYTEEIIDFKLINSRRHVNHELNTIDFIDDSGVIVFRTCEEEKYKVILQIGTNDSNRAVLAAKKVENDVAAIDVNMGCPKSFSLKGGMGAALLENPDKIKNILCSLKANIRKPISCKIRVFKDLDSTLQLVKVIEQSGADALAVHGRTKEERPQHANRNDNIAMVVNHIDIPVIANGDSSHIECYEDIQRFKQVTNASSVMISRSAMKNYTIFDKSKNKIDNIEDLVREYIKVAIDYDNNAINSKYCIQQMLGSLQDTDRGKQLLGAYSLSTISDIYGLHDYYISKTNEQNLKKSQFIPNEVSQLSDESIHIELPVVFDKNIFCQQTLPKSVLNRWIEKNNFEKPLYQTYQVEKQFHTIVHFMSNFYSTPYLEKTKKYAEQSAALVVVLKFGLCDDSKVLDACLLTRQHGITALEHKTNGKTYLIKVNK